MSVSSPSLVLKQSSFKPPLSLSLSLSFPCGPPAFPLTSNIHPLKLSLSLSLSLLSYIYGFKYLPLLLKLTIKKENKIYPSTFPLNQNQIIAREREMPETVRDEMGFSVVKEPRLVVRKFLARPQHEGVGAVVRRSIGRFELKYFDPFLALDEFSVTAPAGFPDHPHRGFETVTYMLQGAVRHEDFEGHKGTIGAGDLQWMTAGKGIVHSEMPAAQGTQKGLQLWINLSSKYKMIEPRYQEIHSMDIAEASKDGVKVRVIAGEALGAKSPIYTRTPTMYLDFTLRPGSHLEQPTPASWNAFVYILEGDGVFGSLKSMSITPHHLLLLGCGDGLQVWNKSSKPLRFILVGGQPLNETVVQLGPFVMNTQEEIDQTIDDFENCTNGFEKARHWRSEAALRLDF